MAQQTRKTVHRTDTTGESNPLTGLVFCADCGAKMYNHRGKHTRADGRQHGNNTYNCSTYTLTIEREEKKCFSHSVSNKALRALILDTIRLVGSYAITNEAEFIEKVRAASEVRQAEAATHEALKNTRRDDRMLLTHKEGAKPNAESCNLR